MKLSFSLLITCLLCVGTSVSMGAEVANNLIPQPSTVQFQPGRLLITKDFAISTPNYSDDRLRRAIWRAIGRLEVSTGLELMRAPENPALPSLVVEVKRSGDLVQSSNEIESYSLQVSPQGAVLRSETVVGALRGLETFLQLVASDHHRYFVPAVAIQDEPRFRWRGLLIDVARHWQPIEVIERNLDGMAAVKLNVFHWHLTDDQGFRIESTRYPKLAELGSDGHYYSKDQVREIVAYARDRGIRVIPEFDMPGHATAWVAAYPELASAPGSYMVEHRFGVFDPALDPTREETYAFIDNLLGEMSTLFPDEYVHVGGDENEGNQWMRSTSIQSFMKTHDLTDAPALQAYFAQRLQSILQRHGKKMLVWEEERIAPEGALLETWHRGSNVGRAVRQGRETLLSTPYYLDQIQPASRLYQAEPLPIDLKLTREQMKLVLGGEACIWGEHVSPETIDSRIWPMLGAVAERFWSSRETDNVADMYRRLDLLSVRLEELGLKHITHSKLVLRSAVHNEDIATLQDFIQLVRPATFDQREGFQQLDQFTPLARLVDAANPDPPYVRQLSSWVDALLSDAPQFAAKRVELEATFRRWRDLPCALDKIAQTSPWVVDAQSRSADLARLGDIGNEALSFLGTGKKPAAGWKQTQLAWLNEAAEPKALVRFAVLTPIRELVVAAGNADRSRSPDVAEWKARIAAEASASAPQNEGYR